MQEFRFSGAIGRLSVSLAEPTGCAIKVLDIKIFALSPRIILRMAVKLHPAYFLGIDLWDKFLSP